MTEEAAASKPWWLAAGAVLVLAGWATVLSGAWLPVSERPLAMLGAITLAGALLVGVGIFLCWRGFTSTRYVITQPGSKRRSALRFATAAVVLSALWIVMQVGFADGDLFDAEWVTLL